MKHGFKKFEVQSLACLAVTLGVLAWSGVAFCGEIHGAVMDENVEKVRALIESDATVVNAKWKHNESTPLMLAAIRGNKELVAILLGAGADVNAKDDFGKTSLHEAAGGKGSGQTFKATDADFKAVVEMLIAHKAEVNARDSVKRMPLHDAALRGKKVLAEMLLDHGADINAKDKYNETPLHDAAFYGSADVVELLLARNADIQARNKEGQTALAVAIQQKQTEVIKILRQHGAKE